MNKWIKYLGRLLVWLAPLLFLFLLAGQAQAAVVSGLNQAVITVPDRSSTAMNAALKTAFTQVLIKVSGNTQVMTLPTIQNALPDLQQWILSYRYVASEDGDKAAGQLQLQVAFDRQGIAQLLQESGQAFLPADRPLTLICVDADQDQWVSLIKQQASDYGLPVVFAAMDLADQAVMQSPDMFSQLSQRYGVQSVLVLHAMQLPDQPNEFKAAYMLNGSSVQWPVTGDQKISVVQSVLGRVMGQIVQQERPAPGESAQSKIALSVTGVQDVADYAKVTHYLRQLADVTDVSVKDMTGSGVIFEVNITGDVGRFKSLLSNDGRLKPVSGELAQNAHGADLYYYW